MGTTEHLPEQLRIPGRRDPWRRLNLTLILLSLLPLLLFSIFPLRHAARDAHQAALKGDLKALDSILRRHPGAVHSQDIHGATPLHFACLAHQLQAARRLLDRGAGVEAVNVCGQTPLFNAVSMNDGPVAELLLRHGANPNHADRGGTTPLHLAVARGFLPMVELLGAWGATPLTVHRFTGQTPLHDAVLRGQVPIARSLLKMGADPARPDKRGQTALSIARRAGNHELILLLEGPGPVGAGTEGSRRN
ncbi:MAG: ankyrin repeat domain-containing protein [Candidatus Eremiobacterota bacterium]